MDRHDTTRALRVRGFAIFLSSCATAAALSACPADDPVVPPIAEGIFSDLGAVRPNATDAEKETFERGLAVARHRFTAEDGLGPRFNVTFCGGCHEKPATGGGAGRYRNFLLVREDLPDGSQVATGTNGVQPQYTLDPESRVPTDESTNATAGRHSIPMFGVGLLAEIPEEEILRHADADDRDGDGISGRPNYDRGFVGRFGRKSQTVSIEGFIRGPLFNHVGITSNPLPAERKAQLPVPSAADLGRAPGALTASRNGSDADVDADAVGVARQAQAAAPDEPTLDDDGVPDPELSEDDLFDLVSFAMLLGAPRPDEPTADTEAGRLLFERIGCDGCHVPALAGPRGRVPAYSDLLLHDMGDELADGIAMGVADGREFRTQPLWGVAAVGPYLHDGRADTLDESIRMHGGESAASRDAYLALTDAERQSIVGFLESLGGRSQRSTGMIPPDAPVPDTGEYGAPATALTGAEAERFVVGRRVFDRDTAIAAGLGPRFNGDSCRACHFDPVVGGSGPSDVDVTRHGILAGDGTFTAPAQGTMAHRHTASASERPPFDATANVVELRQTPAVFGLGLLERVPREVIEALADPDDADGDGIRGRAHVLSDGRLGRLGWKAGVPSLREFARDAMLNELGVTLPDEAGQTFGATTDSDAIGDPEITTTDLQALVFFMERLGPPPRTRTDRAMEDEGERIFGEIGCAACHVPELATDEGTPVRAFTDLLLHDVAPSDAPGIADGAAGIHDFRTAPLWGLARTAPYMHDGRSFTVEDAIERHVGEAEASRQAYQRLGGDDRARLIAFLRSL